MKFLALIILVFLPITLSAQMGLQLSLVRPVGDAGFWYKAGPGIALMYSQGAFPDEYSNGKFSTTISVTYALLRYRNEPGTWQHFISPALEFDYRPLAGKISPVTGVSVSASFFEYFPSYDVDEINIGLDFRLGASYWYQQKFRFDLGWQGNYYLITDLFSGLVWEPYVRIIFLLKKK